MEQCSDLSCATAMVVEIGRICLENLGCVETGRETKGARVLVLVIVVDKPP